MLGIIAAECPSSRFPPRVALNIVCHQVLLILRTYAYWQGDKRVLYGLLAYAGVSRLVFVVFLFSSFEQTMTWLR